MLLSIVIPTYNSSGFIAETTSAIERYVAVSEYDFEVVIVDDGSLDGTYEKLKEIAERSALQMTIVQLFTNRGQFQALMAGLAHASGDYVVTFDDDLEYQPDQINCLLKKFNEEPGKWDVVIGAPNFRKRKIWRNIGSWFTNQVNTIMYNKPRQLHSGGFRLMTGSFVKCILEYRTANPILGPLIFKATRRVTNALVEHQQGLRCSNYSLSSLIGVFYKNLQNFTDFPMRYITNIGFGISILSISASLFFLFQYITGIPWPIKSPGWTSLITSICFFSGLMLAAIGFLGQYVFRVLEEVNKTPNFQIRNMIVFEKRNDGKQR